MVKLLIITILFSSISSQAYDCLSRNTGYGRTTIEIQRGDSAKTRYVVVQDRSTSGGSGVVFKSIVNIAKTSEKVHLWTTNKQFQLAIRLNQKGDYKNYFKAHLQLDIPYGIDDPNMSCVWRTK